MAFGKKMRPRRGNCAAALVTERISTERRHRGASGGGVGRRVELRRLASQGRPRRRDHAWGHICRAM